MSSHPFLLWWLSFSVAHMLKQDGDVCCPGISRILIAQAFLWLIFQSTCSYFEGSGCWEACCCPVRGSYLCTPPPSSWTSAWLSSLSSVVELTASWRSLSHQTLNSLNSQRLQMVESDFVATLEQWLFIAPLFIVTLQYYLMIYLRKFWCASFHMCMRSSCCHK